METIAKCLKEVFYKGHHITKVEDVFGQVAVRIDNVVEPDYASIADAKRVINGKPLSGLMMAICGTKPARRS
jgi:hypothetical protein